MGVKVRERRPGQFWVFVTHKGQRCARCAGSEETANEAKAFIEKQIANRVFQFPKREVKHRIPTLNDYFAKFRSGYCKSAIRESTAERYEQSFDLHILPTLGKFGLNEITREKVKDITADLMAKKLARNTIRNVVAALRLVLNQVIEDGHISTNPAIKLAKYFKQAKGKREIDYLTADEVPLFLQQTRIRDAAKRKGDPEYLPLFLCAVHTGLRAGELAGLQWPDIDWNGSFMMARRSIKKGKINPTKTDKIRRVDMSDDLAEELRAYRRRLLTDALQAGCNGIPEWVFSSGEGTPLDLHNVSKREFPKCLKNAGLRRIRFHDLRHTYASLLIQNGESLAYVKDQLGHSSIKVTVDIYGHLVPGANRQAVNRLPSLKSRTDLQPPRNQAIERR